MLSTSLLGGQGISLADILKICIPATLIGVLAGAVVANFIGKSLEKDPEYLKRLKRGDFSKKTVVNTTAAQSSTRPKTAVIIFLTGVLLVVLFGSVESLRPVFNAEGNITRMNMPEIIEIVMMSIAGLIIIFAKADVAKAVKGNVFLAGMQAVIAIFGIAWMGDTFFQGNIDFFKTHIQDIVTNHSYLFAVALFVMSIFLFSQAATVRTLYPLGIALGIPPMILIALFPAVNGYFFIPNYPTVVAAINFDRTGTTRIGKYILNHSFMIPGLVSTIVAIVIGYVMVSV